MEEIHVQIITAPRADEDNPLDAGLVALTEAISLIDEDVVAHGALGGCFGYGAHWDNAVFTMRPFYWGDCDCGFEQREEEFENTDPGHTTDCYRTDLNNRRKAAGLSWCETKPLRFHGGELSDYDDGPGKAAAKKIYRELCGKHGLDVNGACAVYCTCGYDKRYSEWAEDNTHTKSCALELPNFLHKPSGLEVRWYKWIGRSMKAEIPSGVDLTRMFADCLASLPQRNDDRSYRSQEPIG